MNSFKQTLQAATQCRQAHDYAGARQQWQQLLAQEQAGQLRLSPPQQQYLLRQQWELAPLWWASLEHGAVSLRRCHAADTDFFHHCYTDPLFMNNYCRASGWQGDLLRALHRYGQEPPLALGMVQWVVCLHGQAVGLASLSHLDIINKKAEFSIGIPGVPPPGLALKASLMVMHFAYFMAGLNKLYTYVYEENKIAAKNTERLGFLQEGFLHDHFFLNQNFVNVYYFGLTKDKLIADERILRLAKKCISQSWSLFGKSKADQVKG